MLQFETLCLVILMPIIPAFILFKALPTDTAKVSGKLQGMEIKLGGAFAGYFAVVLLIVAYHAVLIPPPLQVWMVRGEVRDDTNRLLNPLDISDISIDPPSLGTEATAGTFAVSIQSCPDSSGKYSYPTLHVTPDPDKYSPIDPIPLEPGKPLPYGVKAIVDNNAKQISLSVKLGKLGTYNENKAAPASTAEEASPASPISTSSGGR